MLKREKWLPVEYRLIHRFAWLKRIKDRLAESPVAYRLARGAFWSLLGGLASRALTLASSIIIARLLGKEGYGEVGMVQSTLGMLGVFAGFGLGSTSIKYIAEFKSKDPERAGRISNLTILVAIITGGLMALACLGMSGWLAEKTLNRPDLTALLVAGALLLFVSTLGGVLSAALSGFEAFREIARIHIWQGVTAPLITVPLVWFFGVQGAIASMTLSAALGLLLCALALRAEYVKFNIQQGYDRSVWKEWPVLWKFSFPSMISSLLVAPVAWITNMVLVNQPDGYGELGLFTAANQWRMVIIFLPGLLTSAMLPVLSETHGREDQTDFIHTVVLNLRATWIVALPLTVLVVTLGKPLAELFGRQFTGSAPIISVLMSSCFLSVVNGAVGCALVGSGRLWIGAAMNLGWAIALVISALILVPPFGGFGLALSYLLSYVLHTIWQMAYVEIKLAATSILKQWKLILFTALILIMSIRLSLSPTPSYLTQIALMSASVFPLLGMLRSNCVWPKGNLHR